MEFHFAAVSLISANHNSYIFCNICFFSFSCVPELFNISASKGDRKKALELTNRAKALASGSPNKKVTIAILPVISAFSPFLAFRSFLTSPVFKRCPLLQFRTQPGSIHRSIRVPACSSKRIRVCRNERGTPCTIRPRADDAVREGCGDCSQA